MSYVCWVNPIETLIQGCSFVLLWLGRDLPFRWLLTLRAFIRQRLLSSFLFVPCSAFASCCRRGDLLSFWPLGNIILFGICLVHVCTVARSRKCSITFFIFSHTLNGCHRGGCATGLISVSMFKSTWILSSVPFFVLFQQFELCGSRSPDVCFHLRFRFSAVPSGSRWPPYQLPRGPRGTWPTKFYLANRFHVAVRLYSNRSQMTSRCG